MHFFVLYLSSMWTDCSETFLGGKGHAIERSVSETSAKVSLYSSRGIIIRMSSGLSMYRGDILHYRYYDNCWSTEIVFFNDGLCPYHLIKCKWALNWSDLQKKLVITVYSTLCLCAKCIRIWFAHFLSNSWYDHLEVFRIERSQVVDEVLIQMTDS